MLCYYKSSSFVFFRSSCSRAGDVRVCLQGEYSIFGFANSCCLNQVASGQVVLVVRFCKNQLVRLVFPILDSKFVILFLCIGFSLFEHLVIGFQLKERSLFLFKDFFDKPSACSFVAYQ